MIQSLQINGAPGQRFARLYSRRRHTRVNGAVPAVPEGIRSATAIQNERIMTVLEASKSTNARADGFAALYAEKGASGSTSPMSQLARTRTSRPFEIPVLAHLAAHWPNPQEYQKVCPCVQLIGPAVPACASELHLRPRACDVRVVECEGWSLSTAAS
jgi:hypothetical protein